jgi:GH24 family phage-related lysozyme (muramidase)
VSAPPDLPDDSGGPESAFDQDFGPPGTDPPTDPNSDPNQDPSGDPNVGDFGVDYSSNAELVRSAQGKINALGYTPALTVDGKWGPKTSAGVAWARIKLGVRSGSGLDEAMLVALGLSSDPQKVSPPSPTTSSPASLPKFASLIAFASKYSQKVTQGSGVAPGFTATRASVVNSFIPWSGPFEGPLLAYPYTDAEGLVTTGTGNLIDAMASGQVMHQNCGHGTSTPCGQATPTAKARSLPWAGGSIDADWAKLKASWPKIQSTACQGITSARLSKDFLVKLATDQMKANEATLLKGLPSFAQAPADAQLAAHSMAWAMGPGFASTWTQFRNAFNSGDFASAASQSHMRGVGIDMRNLANELLLLNAAAVKALGLNPDRLYYTDPIGAAMGMAAAPIALAGKLMARSDVVIVVDSAIVVGAAVVGGIVWGITGAMIGLAIGGAIAAADIYRRL